MKNVIARAPITTFEGRLDRAIQKRGLDTPVRPEYDGFFGSFEVHFVSRSCAIFRINRKK